MIADTLVVSLARGNTKEAGIAEKLSKGIRRSLHQVRMLSRGLNPVDISPDGLRSALTEMSAHVEDLYGIKCQVYYAWDSVQLDNQFATQLFRIAQEATTNAAKHGLARFVKISLFETDHEFELTVVDDGTGFAPKSNGSPGMGIRSMKYRAGLIGGHLDVSAHSGGGTQVHCRIPMNQIRPAQPTSNTTPQPHLPILPVNTASSPNK